MMFILAALLIAGVACTPTTFGTFPTTTGFGTQGWNGFNGTFGENVTFFPYQNVTFPNWYYRGEFQFLDFQINQTTPFSNNLNGNFEIWNNVTYGANPTGQFSTFSSPSPMTTDGYAQLFAGNYNGGVNNFINIDRTWSADTCGYNWTTGYMNVWVRPLAGFDAGVFQQGYFTCFFNFTFPTTYTPKTGASWTPIFQCNSGMVNNYSYTLWYQFRFYNIPSDTCQIGQFIIL
jgi:hypothetical protein